jgi:protein involved in polysaccharide export with SLBB domain
VVNRGVGWCVNLWSWSESVFWLMLLLALAPPAWAADGAGPQVVAGSPGAVYTVGPGDRIDVEVFAEGELSGELVVEHDGTAHHELLGRVPVAGLTTEAIAVEFTARLAASYLRDPRVSVSVVRYGSKSVKVYGAVRSSEVYLRADAARLDEILAVAGLDAKEAIEVWVRRADSGREEAVNLERLLTAGEGNLEVFAGDVVTVPEGMVVYVNGEVSKPSAVPFGRGLTVTQALTKAGGPTELARLRGAYILREGEKIPVNLKRILDGREADVALKRGDSVVVPQSAF